MTDPSMAGRPRRFGRGQAVPRPESGALLRGRGRFTDDHQLDGCLHVAIARSPLARGRLRGLDTREAAAMPGVAGLFTGESLQAAGVHALPPAHGFPEPGGGPIDSLCRDAGRPEAVFSMVRLMCEAARPLGLNETELRRRNLVKPAQLPDRHPMGQGPATSYAPLAVHPIQIPLARIRIVQGDIDRASGFGSAPSRSPFTGGAAVQAVSRRCVDEARALAAQVQKADVADALARSSRAGAVRCLRMPLSSEKVWGALQ